MGSNERELLRTAEEYHASIGWGKPGSWEARDAVLEAQRNVAISEGESYAEVIDLGVMWDTGAPLPHVVANGRSATLICHASDTPSDWDGTTAKQLSSSDSAASRLLKFTFQHCSSIRFGSPNDEVLQGHPLWGKGLAFYQPHIVHGSSWIAEIDAINSVHSRYRGPSQRNHYLFAFHDETFEAIADSVTAEAFIGMIESSLVELARSITDTR